MHGGNSTQTLGAVKGKIRTLAGRGTGRGIETSRKQRRLKLPDQSEHVEEPFQKKMREGKETGHPGKKIGSTVPEGQFQHFGAGLATAQENCVGRKKKSSWKTRPTEKKKRVSGKCSRNGK